MLSLKVVIVTVATTAVVAIVTGVVVKLNDSKVVELSVPITSLIKTIFLLSVVLCFTVQIVYWVGGK